MPLGILDEMRIKLMSEPNNQLTEVKKEEPWREGNPKPPKKAHWWNRSKSIGSETTIDTKNRKVTHTQSSELLADILAQCSDASAEKNAIWADVAKYVASFFKWSFVTYSITQMITQIMTNSVAAGIVAPLLDLILP